MATILEKISDIENEMARTQKNKATAGHLGMLKAKLAKLRRELITPKSQGGGTGEGFDVAKVGNGNIELKALMENGEATTLMQIFFTSTSSSHYVVLHFFIFKYIY